MGNANAADPTADALRASLVGADGTVPAVLPGGRSSLFDDLETYMDGAGGGLDARSGIIILAPGSFCPFGPDGKRPKFCPIILPIPSPRPSPSPPPSPSPSPSRYFRRAWRCQ